MIWFFPMISSINSTRPRANKDIILSILSTERRTHSPYCLNCPIILTTVPLALGTSNHYRIQIPDLKLALPPTKENLTITNLYFHIKQAVYNRWHFILSMEAKHSATVKQRCDAVKDAHPFTRYVMEWLQSGEMHAQIYMCAQPTGGDDSQSKAQASPPPPLGFSLGQLWITSLANSFQSTVQ